jgi:capsular polysaccharide transport system permease protein
MQTWQAVRSSGRVMWAVMLRDIRTRFFNHGLGFSIAIGFPLVHILILIGIWSLLGRDAPFGDSTAVFFGVALAPFMAWNYMSRFIMLSLVMNRPLLAFPAVKILDILFGRGLLEVLGSCLMLMFLVAIGLATGHDVSPADPVDAVAAWLAALGLGLGFGMVNAVIAMAAPFWVTGYTLLVILLYMISGIVFLPTALPEAVGDALAWLPTLQVVEWMRTAFFEGYPDTLLHRGYLVAWVGGSVIVGLGLERVARGRLLGG